MQYVLQFWDTCWRPESDRGQTEVGQGSEFGSERSYQISEEGNGIGLGFNLCVVPTRTICSMSYNFRTVIGGRSQTEIKQELD